MVEILYGSSFHNLLPSSFSNFSDLPEYLRGSYQVANPTEADKKLYIEFGVMAKLLFHKSQLAGRQVYENVDIVKIRTPDGEEFINDLPIVNGVPHWKRIWYSTRFPVHWKRFQEEFGENFKGTPISTILYDPSILATLNHANIRTVEQLAKLEGSILDVPGLLKAKEKAKTYLQNQDILAVDNIERESLLKERDAALQELEQLRAVLASKVNENESSENSDSNTTRGGKTRKV